MATIEQRIYNGDQARLVLENEAFAAAFADMKAEFSTAMFATQARDVEGREKLYMMVKLADKLEAILRASLDDGKLAKHELRHERSLAERAKEAIGL
jgi:vacuolar-type H+-ATPase subunit B/Vma2